MPAADTISFAGRMEFMAVSVAGAGSGPPTKAISGSGAAAMPFVAAVATTTSLLPVQPASMGWPAVGVSAQSLSMMIAMSLSPVIAAMRWFMSARKIVETAITPAVTEPAITT